jgi:hypothetical protein
MVVFDTFSVVICLFMVILLVLIFKIFHTIAVNKNQIYLSEITLCNLLVKETKKSQIMNNNLKLVDDLNKSIIYRLLKITKELLSIQNLIFEKPI